MTDPGCEGVTDPGPGDGRARHGMLRTWTLRWPSPRSKGAWSPDSQARLVPCRAQATSRNRRDKAQTTPGQRGGLALPGAVPDLLHEPFVSATSGPPTPSEISAPRRPSETFGPQGPSDMSQSYPTPDVDLAQAASRLRAALPWVPEILIVLGSGLGGLGRTLDEAGELSFSQITGLPGTGVAGHRGSFRWGVLNGRRVLLQAGRFHLYEGHGPEVVAAPVRVAARLGVQRVVLTNAAGGINRRFVPGSIMLIVDHLNLMWSSPLTGPVRQGEERFPDMSAPYDPTYLALAQEVALEEGIELERGSYAGVLGPNYETPAEIRMLDRMGADAVGMSTVPEAIVARAAGLRVVAFSLITNHAAGISRQPLSHDEVLAAGQEAAPRLERLIQAVVGQME